MIYTFSSFYYGHTVTSVNNQIDFSEGGSELTAVLNVGSYTLTKFLAEVKRALDQAGALTYTVTVNRATRFVTISATGNFELLVGSGSHAGTSNFGLLGFSGSDRTGAASYVANLATGFSYEPPFKLQNYLGPSTNNQSVDSTVLESTNGDVQVVKFGNKKFIKCVFKYVTDKSMVIPGAMKPTGPGTVQKLLDFMDYCITKSPMEFMEDADSPSTFYSVLLESTGEEKKGTSYELKELYDKGLPDIYETSLLTFRLIEV